MIKYVVTILFFLIAFQSFAQLPLNQKLGNDSTRVYTPGAFQSVAGLINGSYTDTTAANLTRIMQYSGSLIFCTSTNSVWLRNSTANKWIEMAGGSSLTAGSGIDITGTIVSNVGRFGKASEDTRATASRTFSMANNAFLFDSLGTGSRFVSRASGTTRGIRITNTNGTDSATLSVEGATIGSIRSVRLNTNSTATGTSSSMIMQDGGGTSITQIITGNTVNQSIFNIDTSIISLARRAIGGGSIYNSVLELHNGFADQWADDSLFWRTSDTSSAVKLYINIAQVYAGQNEIELNNPNGITIEPYKNNLFIDSLTTASNMTGRTLLTWNTSTGLVENISISSIGATIPINSLLDATATNTIENSNFAQQWKWSSLSTQNALQLSSSSVSSGTVLDLTVTGTAATSNSQKALNISLSGANTDITQATYGIKISNTHTGGALGENVGIFGRSSGNDSNTGANFAATGAASVNIGAIISATGATTTTALSLSASGGTGNLAIQSLNGRYNITIPDVTTGTTTSSGFIETYSALTSGTAHYITSSTQTSGNLLQLAGTSTALAANNELLDISLSGVNATNAITATGMRISVTNTNVTSGTNVGLEVTASGATTGNYAALFTGNVGIGTATPAAKLDLGTSGAAILPSIQTLSTGVNGDFFTATGGGSTSTTSAPYLYLAAANAAFKAAFNGTTSTVLSANHVYSTVEIAASVITEATSGTHPLLASLVVLPPTITNGVATVTNTATVYISGAPTTTGSTNYGFWLDAGSLRFDGELNVNSSAGSSGDILVSGGAAASPAWTTKSSITGLPYIALTGTSVLTGDISIDMSSNPNFKVITGGSNELFTVNISAKPIITMGDVSGAYSLTKFTVDDQAVLFTFNTGTVKMDAYGAGTATFDASGNISSVSDGRLKFIKRTYTAGLNEIMQLHPIVYKWRPESKMETEHEYAGLDAREVHEVMGDIATGINKDGYYSIQDRALIVALINAVQEQQKQIDYLKSKIK